MYPEPNPLKQKVAQGKAVTGLYIQTPGADCIEIAADAGFDYVIIDEEHGNFGFSETLDMIRFAEAARICPIVRVNSHDGEHIRKVTEAGAMGVCIPRVETAEQARSLVAASKYSHGGNGGSKGACPTNRAARSRGKDWEAYVRWSNENVLIFMWLESRRALTHLEEIVRVEGVDCFGLGRFDLAHEMGLYGDRWGTELTRIAEDFVKTVEQAGVHYLARLTSFEFDQAKAQFDALVARGARYFALGSDRQLLDRRFRDVWRPTGVIPVLSAT
jgi:4-hydroxy-2-oxoheptanedioate aldolase